ncbi:MAG: filamentous hemagglutinin N-terminal domain-containing protein, partial [Planctomycetota bacterium]
MKTRTPSNTAIASRRARSGNRRDLGFVLGGVAAALASVPVVAQPVNARVTAGSARIDSNGNRTVITTSDRAIIEADSFNVGRNDVVIFRQPGSNSRVLNRITGATPTEIFGTIRANGNVFFTNPAGIYFGNGAVLDVGGLYAAAGSISDADFLNGNFNFTNLTGSVINEGAIFAQNGIHLIGAHVANFGSLVTESGVVTLAAGDDVLIGERNGRLFARIEGGNLSADGSRNLGVENAGTIQADRAVLGVGDHFALALYDTSVIYADAVDVIGGENSFATVSGTIDASNANGVGGSIDIATDRIALEGATLDASGSLGGGTIRVGADRGGASIDGRDAATRVAVDADSTLSANATVDGDGGEIVVYAKDATAFWGLLEARGAGTGEGGFAEVSAKGQLTLNGGVDLSGPAGDGTLLLDPDFIEIVADGTATAEPAAPGAVAFADAGESGGLTQFEESTLEQLLDNQAIGTLVLQANSDITFESGVTIDTFNVFDGDNITASLTLEAGRSIIMNTDVVIDLPTGDVTLIANSQNPDVAGRAGGLGSILMFDNASITTQAGSIALDLQGTGNTATDGAIIIANLTARGMNAGEGVVLVQNTGEGSGIFNSTDSDNSGGHSVIADQRVILASLSDGTQTGSFDFGAVGSLLIPTLFDGPITIDAPSITLASTNQIPEFNLVQSDITIESAAAGLAVGGTTVAQDLQGIEFRAGVNQQQFMGLDVFSDALVLNLAGELTLADGASIIGTATNNTGGALDIIDITATALNLGDGSSISVTQIGAPGDTLDIDINAPVVMNGGSSISTDNGSVSITGGVTDGAMGAAGDLAVSGSEGVTIDGGDITLTNNANANGLDLDSANGAITVANVDSDGAVTMDGGLAVSAMDVTGVSVGMSGDSVSAGNVTATDGAVTLDGTSFVTALDVASQDAGGDMTPGGITVTSTGQVMLGETVNDADGLSTANGGISVAGMDIDVAGTVMAVNSGASLVAGSNGGGSVDVVDAMGDGAAITAEGPVLVAAGDGSVLVGDVNATDGSVTMTATTTIMAGDVTSSGIAGGITVVASDQVTLGETANNADGLSSVMGDILV